MTVAEIVQMIANIGFPAVCVIFMWRYITQTLKELTEAINNNSMIVQKLVEKFDKRDDI